MEKSRRMRGEVASGGRCFVSAAAGGLAGRFSSSSSLSMHGGMKIKMMMKRKRIYSIPQRT